MFHCSLNRSGLIHGIYHAMVRLSHFWQGRRAKSLFLQCLPRVCAWQYIYLVRTYQVSNSELNPGHLKIDYNVPCPLGALGLIMHIGKLVNWKHYDEWHGEDICTIKWELVVGKCRQVYCPRRAEVNLSFSNREYGF